MLKRIQIVLKDTFNQLVRKNRCGKYSMGCIPDTMSPNDHVFMPKFGITAKMDSVDSIHRSVNPDAVEKRFRLEMSDQNRLPMSHTLVDMKNPPFEPRNQGKIGSCASFAGAHHHELTVWLRDGVLAELSPRYLYLITRRMAGLKGDSGSQIRDVVRALRVHGSPPELMWPYSDSKNPFSNDYYDKDPSWFVSHASKSNIAVGATSRLDIPSSNIDVLINIKLCLYNNLPVMGGFYLADHGDSEGRFAVPKNWSEVVGGHAMLIMGYSDNDKGVYVMNSWGPEWGVNGFGFVPYTFFKEFARDFWIAPEYEYVQYKHNFGYGKVG